MAGATPLKVLFVCGGATARAIIAEAIMNRVGAPRIQAFAAGEHPEAALNPHAAILLKSQGYLPDGLKTKPLDDFRHPDAPALDFVFAVSDDAVELIDGPWPGDPVTANWSVPDPELATGSDAQIGLAFAETFRQLNNRITLFANLPLETLDRLALQAHLDAIGEASSEQAATLVG